MHNVRHSPGILLVATFTLMQACQAGTPMAGEDDDDDAATESSAADDDDDQGGSSADSSEGHSSTTDDDDEDDEDDDDDASSGADDDDDNESGDTGSTEGSSDATTAGTDTDAGHPACALAITQIELYQATRVELAKDGEASTSLAPVIAGRPGFIRVHVAPHGDAAPVTATLTLKTGDDTKEVSETKTIESASEEGELDSTFNLAFDGEMIAADTSYSLALTQESACDDPARWRFPEQGSQDLGAQKTGKVTVVVVPIVTANGREPYASAQLVERFADDADALYPSTGFEVSLGERQDWPEIDIPEMVTSQEDADRLTAEYLEMLDKVCELRASEGGDNVHYYGLIAPNQERTQVLVAGLATNPARENPGALAPSCAVGVSYDGDEDYASETFYHELGHAHSQSHTPGCDAGAPDEAYPYGSDGEIGVWGWDRRSNTLMDPESNRDFLSYCTPYWVSDYVYNKLVEPVRKIAAMAVPAADRRTALYRTVFVRADQTLQLGRTYAERVRADGDATEVEVVDARGKTSRVRALRYTIDDLGAQMLRVPMDVAWASIRVGQHELRLR